MTAQGGCPFDHANQIPDDGTPTSPSEDFERWRDLAAFVPLRYRDGHEGLLATRYDQARAVLSDPRFSQQPQRMPASRASLVERVPQGEIDDWIVAAQEVSNVLGSDGGVHLRLRRGITKRFSVRSARGHAERISQIVAEQLDVLRSHGSPADVTALYAEPISARVHALVLGIPEPLVSRFTQEFVHGAPRQQQCDLLREAVEYRRQRPGEDVLSDMLAGDFTDAEVEGMAFTLSVSGRDTVAYMIVSGLVALLGEPEQLRTLQREPELIPAAVEEIVRFVTMFITLFPRTATEDLEIDGQPIAAGTTVSVSAVSANRDPARWGEDASRLDVRREARGHLAFGDGPHMCVGQQVARVEIAEGLRALILGLPGLRLVHADQLVPQPLAHPVATYEAGAVVVAW